MSKSKDDERRLNPKCYATADLILKTLVEDTASPGEAIIVLAMAHVKLWTQYGGTDKNETVDMLASYLANFFTLDKAVRENIPDGMLH